MNGAYECSICSRRFGSFSSLDHHMTEHETSGNCRKPLLDEYHSGSKKNETKK
jgi:hypothetical protein